VVLVTGGTKGIGRTICERYLQAGATVVTCGRHEPEVAIRAGDATAGFVATDVRDPEAVDALVDGIVAEHGQLDVVVNNAGGSPEVAAADASPRFSAAIVQLNLLAPLHVSTRANRQMQEQEGGGVIVNIASVSGTRPSPGTAAYGAAKAGLLSLTASLAVEWAPKVRVVAVTCGLIATEQADLHYGDDDGMAAVAATVPLGRMGTPADVADASLFLSSPAASYVSGSSLLLHGGGEWPAFLRAR
jgi:NAD(P)-dependent dehydrogenase (short-subunit alcohol dehydrogenase family)